jgi:hypothetical protein
MIADELARVRSEANHELEGLYQQLRAQDLEWRDEKTRLQSQLWSLRDELRSLAQRRGQDRRDLQETIRQKKAALRNRLRARSSELPSSG